MARAPVKKPAPPPEAPPPRRLPLPDMGRVEAATTRVRTLAVNFAVLGAFIVLLPVIVSQFGRSEIKIEPISVPPVLAERGLSPEVAANRLWDGLQQVKAEARTSKASVDALPQSLQVNFSIPDSGISIDSLIHYVRRFLNIYETSISGEFLCADPECSPEGLSLRLRIVRNGSDLVELPPIGVEAEEDYFRDAASGVMSVIDPFTAIAYQSATAPLTATVLARRLIRANHADSEWAFNLIGNMRLDAGDIDGAITEYRAALANTPGFATARANLANALRIQGDLTGARKEFEALARQEPGNVFALSGFADLALLDGKPDDAIAFLLRAGERDRLSPTYLAKAGNIELNRGNTDQGKSYLTQALSIDPTYPGALAVMAYEALAASDYRAAERLYRDAADYAPRDAAIQDQHAGLLMLVGDHRDALARADTAIALSPQTASYHQTRGEILAMLERRDDAESEFAKALELSPDTPGVILARANNLKELGRPADAVLAYRRFVELAPDDVLAPLAQYWITSLSPEPDRSTAATP